MALDALGEGEGILDGGLHGGDAQLGLDAAVAELHHGVHHRLRVHHHLDVLRVDAEEPFGFDHLQAFVHQRGAVDGHLAAHAPVGVLEGLLKGDVASSSRLHAAEGAAAGGEEYLVHGAPLADEALEDGRVLAVDGQYGHAVAQGGGGDDAAGHHHGLLVGQGYGLAVLDGTQRGPQAGETYDGGQHHVDGVHLHEVDHGWRSGKDLDPRWLAGPR